MEKDAFRSPDPYHQQVSSHAPTRSYPHPNLFQRLNVKAPELI